MFDYDFFVIGAGSGGVRASRMAAQMGAKVGICEDYRVGGTCVLNGLCLNTLKNAVLPHKSATAQPPRDPAIS